ncbi:radical SAM protein [candidate division WWE3 bacterium]|nr:radical SAM protein [candidate division WWE3 bacterium]
MKVAIAYPPIETNKGVPLLSQNRQFQYFNTPTYIYPMVPAYAASLAQKRGHEVIWMDGIASEQTYAQWLEQLDQESPDVLVIESKAPVIRKHWEIIKEVKQKHPKMITILVGDHVTYDPKESMENSVVDMIIRGGDFDFVLADLLDAISSQNKEAKIPGGVWLRKDKSFLEIPKEQGNYDGEFWISGPMEMHHNLDSLPFIDRDLTQWKLYAYENGNFKYKPGTYVYSGRDCWWGKCTFCIWNHSLFPQGTYRHFSPHRLFDEVKHLVDNYRVREIFDDAGTMFVGEDLKTFCRLLIDSGYNKKVVYSCNMRLKALDQETYDLMGDANFRYILYGFESGNQETLDRIDKGLQVEEIEQGLRMAKNAGLEPHITIMVGYPWETEEMARNTINLAKEMFKKGLVDTMQATITVPYPGTPLYKECVEKDLLLVDPKDYEKFDMRGPVMKVPFDESKLHDLTQELYTVFMTPKFILRKVMSIRSWDDIAFFIMAGRKLMGHLLDFDRSQEEAVKDHAGLWKKGLRKLMGKKQKA